MIIPVSPVPVRIALETQAINNGGYVVHDINVAELIEKADSAQYELQLCYGTTSLYRSILYQVNKTSKTITFFFMVGNDLYSAALTSANGRCTFKKIPFGDTLPTVTSAYEGYVLTVNELGEWVAAEASGGASYDVVLHCTSTTGFTNNASDYVWEVGDIPSVLHKAASGQPVTGYAYALTSTYDDEDQYTSYNYLILPIQKCGALDYGYDNFEGLSITFDNAEVIVISATAADFISHSLTVVATNEDPDLSPSFTYQSARANIRP